MRHIHADVIIAWAEGAQIQYFAIYESKWFDVDKPLWDPNIRYRVKPKDRVLYAALGPFELEDGIESAFVGNAYNVQPINTWAIEIIFDADTEEPKSVALVKG